MKSWFKRAASIAVLSTVSMGSPVFGQGTEMPQSRQSKGVLNALFSSSQRESRDARFTDMVNAHGENVVVPAQYCGDSCGPYGCDSGACGGASYGMSPMGELCNSGYCSSATGTGPYGPTPPQGTYPSYPYDEGMHDMIGAGALGIDQCGPHYFDARIEAVFLTRDDYFSNNTNFTVDNQNVNNVVLSSSDLSSGLDAGFRVLGRFDLGPLSVLEFGYMGIFDAGGSADALDADNPAQAGEGDLFSLFSGAFSTNPPAFVPAGIVVPNGPNAPTERSHRQSISLESDLQTAEMLYRRYWVGYSPRISGTLLAGFRYTQLGENFNYFTVGGRYADSTGDESLSYDVRARNELAGFQAGGDVWVTVRQGLRIGAEGKVGLYNNHHKVTGNLAFSDTRDVLGGVITNYTAKDDKVAFLAEWSVDVVADILPSWSIRGGYEFLLMTDLALAGDNFDGGALYVNQAALPQRRTVPTAIANGEALYHGFHVGAEYIW